MPEIIISHDALSNIVHHLTQEVRYFEQEGDQDKARAFNGLAEELDEANCSGVREITLRISIT